MFLPNTYMVGFHLIIVGVFNTPIKSIIWAIMFIAMISWTVRFEEEWEKL